MASYAGGKKPLHNQALAVRAVDKFRGYIEGVRTTIVSDHQPLEWLLGLKSPDGLLLQALKLDIQYVPGKANVVASMYLKITEDNFDSPIDVLDVCVVNIDLPRHTAVETQAEQLKDKEIKEIMEAFEEDSTKEVHMRFSAKEYIMPEGVLYVPVIGPGD